MMPCSPIHKSKERFKLPYSPIPVVPPFPAVTFDDVPTGKPPPMNPPPSIPIDSNEQYYNRLPPNTSFPIPQPNTTAVHDPKHHAEGQQQRHHHHQQQHQQQQQYQNYQQQDHHHRPQDHQSWNNNNPPPPGYFIDSHGPSDTATAVSCATNEQTEVRFHNNNNNNNNNTTNTHPIPVPAQTGYHDQRHLDAPLPNVPTATTGNLPYETNLTQTRTTGACAIPVRGNNAPPNLQHEMMGLHPHQQYSLLERNNTDHYHLQNDTRRPNIVPINSSPLQGSNRIVQQPPPFTHNTLYHRHHHHQDNMPLLDTTMTTNIVPPGTPSPTEGHPQQPGHLQQQTPILHHTLFNESIRQDLFERLTRYKKNYGHCYVPIKYITDPQLGKWARAVRTLDKYAVPPHFLTQLESIGFYDPPPPPTDKNNKTTPRTFQRTSATLERQWKEMFQRVVKFKEIHGHCQVPFHYKQDPKLGYWVKNQRFKKDRLTQARHDKLEEIGFEWEVASKVQNQTWNEMFERLQKFETSHKHCFVPSRYKEDPKLGSWVHRQRHLKDKLPADRRAKLDSIGFL